MTEEAREIIGARQAATSMVLNPDYPHPINVISSPTISTDVTGPTGIDAPTLQRAIHAESRPIRLTQDDLLSDPRWRAMEKAALVVPAEGGWLSAPLVGRNGKSIGLLQLADKLDGDVHG